MHFWFVKTFFLSVLGLTITFAQAKQVLYVFTQDDSTITAQVKQSSDFYGLQLAFHNLDTDTGLLSTVLDVQPKALILSGTAVNRIELSQVRRIIAIAAQKNIDILLFQLDADVDEKKLSLWSNDVISAVQAAADLDVQYGLSFAPKQDINRELSGQKTSLRHFPNYSFNQLRLKKPQEFEALINLENNAQLLPLFGKTRIKGANVFFQARFHLNGMFECQDYLRLSELNASLAVVPLFIFLRNSCDESCWHRTQDYANLTIDDPWLTEPYGALSFVDVLKEMQARRFHTTIAYIPWNYDRSERNMITLFRNNPAYYSICYHGNNHDHREFDNYADPGNGIKGKTLADHDSLIQQALARMATFTQLTGLAVDPVFVFPHGISPQHTLCLLKKYHFLSTANYGHVPRGEKKPKNPFFWLNVTANYCGFPSLNRYYPDERTSFDMAIDLFLDNPLLFFHHQELFYAGADAFNNTAKMVNDIQPKVVWAGLGHISEHLYSVKKRADGAWDVQMMSNKVTLHNEKENHAVYFLQKFEPGNAEYSMVRSDGQMLELRRDGDFLLGRLDLVPHASITVQILYKNNFNPLDTDVSKTDAHVARLRKISDIRDLMMSKNVVGRWVIKLYYNNNHSKKEMLYLAVLITFTFVVGTCGVICLIRFGGKKKTY